MVTGSRRKVHEDIIGIQFPEARNKALLLADFGFGKFEDIAGAAYQP